MGRRKNRYPVDIGWAFAYHSVMNSLPPIEISNAGTRRQFDRVMAASRYASQLCRQTPQLVQALVESGDLEISYAEDWYQRELQTRLQGCADRPGLHKELRQLRQREWLRIVWRDFCRLADTMETTRDLSLLAEACVEQAQQFLHRELVEEHGQPRGPDRKRQQLLVLAMGKLGGRELNLSSDIDLIFVYPEAGVTDAGLGNQEVFLRLGQRLITALEQVTEDGFVFRVDMRLRPYGRSGALVMPFAALEEYYQGLGRDWERYALIKARAISGEPAQHRALMEILQPFVFRRYLDYGAIESLRNMKASIEAETHRRELIKDVKLGPGGIREVEFIAQCFQLIRGGRCAALRQRQCLETLDACAEEACLPPSAVSELKAAYLFLRNVEHAIQGYDDQQSQLVPDSEEARAALLIALDFASWDEFESELSRHRDRVSGHFAGLIALSKEEESVLQPASPWPLSLDTASLSAAGFAEAEAVAALLREFRDGAKLRYLQAESSRRLDRFMPKFLAGCLAAGNPRLALQRVLPLVEAVVRRSAYLVLLIENPAALEELILLCSASPWISTLLASHPALLDELLNSANLYSEVDKPGQALSLRRQIARLSESDPEAKLELLGYFKASRQLCIAAGEVTGRLPLMLVSDKLSLLAEVVLEQAMELAWHELTVKHGWPSRAGIGSGFAIIGYGKLGGIELGHNSDLDLVFLYDASLQGQTDGERPLNNTLFYSRLGQKIINILATRTAMGQLYECDMRLRPSGNSGMLVVSFNSYREYQLNSAWTWEHQALVRARFVAGDAALGQRFDGFRRQILRQARDQKKLALDVVQMRDRMREQLLPGSAQARGEFHFKQGRGGMVDIEFMVQYAVLAWSRGSAELAAWPDNVRILEVLGKLDRLTEREATALTDAYIHYRSATHQLALQQQPQLCSGEDYQEERAMVVNLWNRLLG